MTEEQRKAQAEQAIHHIRTNFTKDKMCNDTMEVYADILTHTLRAFIDNAPGL